MIDFLKASEEKLNMMISIRRELHMHPEIDRALNSTANLVQFHLNKLGISFKRYENNGIIAEFGNNSDEKRNNVIALRADMDALEVFDLKDVSYKSQNNGYMHACGHDAHTAILIGTAAILKDHEDELNGRVRLIFQPAEETDGGAKDMIKFGALKDVKCIVGLHVEESIPTGTIGVNKGIVYAASNPFTIKIAGKGSHGASPHDGVDSIHIAAKIIDNLQGIISREISATDSAVITIGKVSGGTAINAICSSITMQGILRTLGVELRTFSKERMRTVVEMTAKMYRGEATINFIEGYPSFENDNKMVNKLYDIVNNENAIKLIDIKRPSMGVEDFAYYGEVVPALFYKLGCRNEAKGIIHPAHGSYFDLDEECMKYGAMMQSKCAYSFLETI